MTLILGVACEEGLVLAADGQATVQSAGLRVKFGASKLRVPWTNLAYGGAGHVGLIQRVSRDLENTYGKPDAFVSDHPNDVRKKVTTTIAKTVRELVQGQYLSPPNQEPALASFLFAGHTNGGQVLFQITPLLVDESAVEPGYCAIGSGELFPYIAMTGLGHFGVTRRNLRETKLLTMRVMQDAIDVADAGIGPPISLVQITSPPKGSGPGSATLLDEGELQSLSEAVLTWKELEKETLQATLGIDPSGGAS